MNKYVLKCGRSFEGNETTNTVDVFHDGTGKCAGCPHSQPPKKMRNVLTENDIVPELKPYCIAEKVG
jgi:hypothetical protein